MTHIFSIINKSSSAITLPFGTMEEITLLYVDFLPRSQGLKVIYWVALSRQHKVFKLVVVCTFSLP